MDAGTLTSLVAMLEGNATEEQTVAARCLFTLSFDVAMKEKIKSEQVHINIEYVNILLGTHI